LKQVVEAFGKTVESAIAEGAAKLGVDRELVAYEILENPKKGFLGFGEVPAKVRVTYDAKNENKALEFVNMLIKDMGIEAEATMSDIEGRGKLIRITGKGSGVLIGHHGATLDALQYLVNLAANKRSDSEQDEQNENDDETENSDILNDETQTGLKAQMTERIKTSAKDYTHITVDIENYRIKREETLRALARRMASKVQKYNKSITLEPMNPYERRIIHSEIQDIEGVMTTSIGTDNERKIIIYPENGEPPHIRTQRGRYGKNRSGAVRNEKKSDTSYESEKNETE